MSDTGQLAGTQNCSKDMTQREFWMSHEQALIHAAIIEVGGYWDPPAAVLRMIEELGELAEAFDLGVEATLEELADLLIIATCVANQFQLTLERIANLGPSNPQPTLKDLVEDVGRIARIVNYYAGPKRPRVADGVGLHAPIASLQANLHRMARHLGQDLPGVVRQKVKLFGTRDITRFEQSYDPSTSDCAMEFRAQLAESRCNQELKIWGSPDWNEEHGGEVNCARIIPYVRRFIRAMPIESLDLFCVDIGRFPHPTEIDRLQRRSQALLRSLGAPCPEESSRPQAALDVSRTTFSLDGIELVTRICSSIFPEKCNQRPNGAWLIIGNPKSGLTNVGLPGSFAVLGEDHV